MLTAIANPRLWRLEMLLDTEERALHVAAVSTVGEESMLCRRIELAPEMPLLRALEDAVYDNPMLLADFDRTTILVRTPAFVLLPEEVAADPAATAYAAALARIAPETSRMRLYTHLAPATGVGVCFALDSEAALFLERTFADARIAHELTTGIAYFAAKAPRSGNSPKVFAIVSAGHISLMAYDGARLAGATAYACSEAADMAYYAAATAQVCGIASPELQFYVAGAPAARDTLVHTLRGFAPHVMPWSAPSEAIATGADLNTPFSLLILPLCE